MAEKLTTTFTTRESAEAAKSVEVTDPTSKKKLYAVTLPSVEAYKQFLDNAKSSQFWMWTDGYASTAYTILRYFGGEVSVAPKDNAAAKAVVDAALAAKATAEEAARKAAEEAESTKQLLAAMQAELAALKAQQNGAEQKPETGRGRKQTTNA